MVVVSAAALEAGGLAGCRMAQAIRDLVVFRMVVSGS